jgi:hypothetical protein
LQRIAGIAPEKEQDILIGLFFYAFGSDDYGFFQSCFV